MNHYPLWKNLLLIIIIILGAVYAAPNLYGSDPSLQISYTGDADLENFKKTLNDDKSLTSYRDIEYADSQITIRYNSVDEQLHARDVLQANLTDDFSLALNMISRTPAWLLAIGAKPLSLGLDLSGGIHLLLEVDTSEHEGRVQGGKRTSLYELIKDERIDYDSSSQTSSGVQFTFANKDARNNAMKKLRAKRNEFDYQLRSDGGSGLFVEFLEQESVSVQDQIIEQSIEVLRNRVNELGVSEAAVQRQGRNRIAVDMPGIQDPVRAKKIVGATAKLEFYLVDAEKSGVLQGNEGTDSKNRVFAMRQGGGSVVLDDELVLSGESIISAMPSFSQEDARPIVNITIQGGSSGRKFSRITGSNIGRRLAIVRSETKTLSKKTVAKEGYRDCKPVQVNDTEVFRCAISEVISAPTIQSQLPRQFQISGVTVEEADELALILRTGAFKAPIDIIQEQTIGPSLGADNIARGRLSIIIGLITVVVFMMMYYNVFGVIANIALLVNMILLTAILSILGATLTLPGVAGIVLTMGMAVDANVLVFERIREELRAKRTVQASIFSGYDRALVTILDANLTTMFVGLILFVVGTGAVKGFAVTLMFGLITSMFTAIMVTRAIVNKLFGRKETKKLPIGL